MPPELDSDFERKMDALGALADPGRRALYRYVVSRAPADVSRDDAARAAGMPRALAAFHLDRLVRSGLLEPVYRRLSGRTGPGAGRPAKLYRRAEREVAVSLPPRRYDLVAQIAVQALAERPSGVSLDDVCAAAQDVGRGIGRDAAGDDPLAAALTVLDEHGFEPTQDEGGAVR